MSSANIKKITLLTALIAVTLVSGCTNWKQKYDNLNVEHQNMKGLLERERAEKGQLVTQVTETQQTIEQLQEQIYGRNISAGEATGFGKDYNVAFDPYAGTITVTLSNAILFDPGKARLKKKTSTELNHIYSVLQEKYASKQIDIVGHTDSDPIKKSKWKDNWELSSERALSVVRYLTKQGVGENQLRSVGCGAARPVSSNASKTGKARNRRVEIVVHMK
ncbi:MAG: OmpA family protein [Planctomycetes bacterium]|nr:OmpA family protein [Planctomycetota bacterium]